MKKTELMAGMARKMHKLGFKVKQRSPEILVIGGAIGVVASAVMACKATLKVNEVLDEAKTQIDTVHEVANDPNMSEKYTEEDKKKDLSIVYIQTGVKLVKLYGPSVVLGVASLACILTSHKILRKRNMALAAAYATVDRSFKEYRGRVVERFGEELDRELKYNIKAKQVEETVVNEDGTETVATKTVNAVDPTQYSEYARFFDDGCIGWEKNPEYNLMFVRQVQNWANERLKSRGYLFLNEVYEMFGFPMTEAGQVVGWVYDKEIGDGFVDFGVYDLYNEKARDFVNGRERVILLDFNVDGNVAKLLA